MEWKEAQNHTKNFARAKNYGGVNLVNFQLKDLGLKATWLPLLAQDKVLSELVFQCIAPKLKSDLWRCAISVEDVKHVVPREVNPFWHDVLLAWETVRPRLDMPNDFIWYNSEIKIAGKMFFWNKPYSKGLCYVHQIFDNGVLRSYGFLRNTYGLSQMDVNSLVSAIPAWMKAMPETPEQVMDDIVNSITSARVYAILNQQNCDISQKCVKWNADLNSSMEIDSDQSSFCSLDKESYLHIFMYCPCVRDIWLEVETFMNRFTEEQINFNCSTVIFNRLIDQLYHIKNFICLVVKQYIYAKRCLKEPLVIEELKRLISNLCNTEKYIAIKNGNVSKHYKKWYNQYDSQVKDYIHEYLAEL